jgi:hypothetical protein
MLDIEAKGNALRPVAIRRAGRPRRTTTGGRSKFFYWDDVPSRRLRPNILTREQALEQAKALARAERERGEGG